MKVARLLPVAFVVVTLIGSPTSGSDTLSKGTARGVGSADLSLDDGKSWLSVSSRSLPILDETRIRTGNGSVSIEMSDGSRLSVLPFTVVRLRGAAETTQAGLQYGRLGFRLLHETRIQIRTPTLRLEPVRTEVMSGEIFVAREGMMGLKMAAGSVQVHELTGGGFVQIGRVAPMFLPRRPDTTEPLFSSEVAVRPPADARAVFDPNGRSLGYLDRGIHLIVHPGYTSDLTEAFPRKLVTVAVARIVERDRADATPVFDLNGGYVGYVLGPVFYARRAEEIVRGPPDRILDMEAFTFYGLVGSLAAVVGVGAAGSFHGGGHAATPFRPGR
jgi:FecR protein